MSGLRGNYNLAQESGYGFIDTNELPAIERLPGWRGRYFDSPSMTFGHYEFDAGSSIHEHFHPQEEVWQILEGEVEITIDGVTWRAGPGFVGVVPPHTPHAVKAISGGKAIVVEYPLREAAPHPGTPALDN
jgi:quercetin dioxygenase-like cupin family protein